MASTNESELCGEVLEHLAEVLDGTASAELLDHLAECDRCRDVKHEAEQARRLAAEAGLDHRPAAELEARVLAALDARTESAKAEPRGKAEPARRAAATTEAAREAAGAKAGRAAARKESTPATASGTSPRTAVVVTGLALAAAAAVVMIRGGSPGAGPPGSWSGTVERVVSAHGSASVLVCDADGKRCSPGSSGARLASGARVKTDVATRAELKLSDGTRVTLDRSTELALLAGEGRGARLVGGGLVADVAHQKNEARFELPAGGVTVHGTKFALRTQGKAASVDVARGSVTLSDAERRSVRVAEGESGRLEPGAEPFVAYSSTLSDSLGWSDEAFGEERAAVAGRGLGELKARKPGQTAERAGAVVLTSHEVRVRIAGVVARTEIEEVFENRTDEVLEGIYRFPLPPDAQIERLALDVDGKLEDGAFVDRDRAAAIFRGAIFNAAPKQPKSIDEIVWVPGPWRDPALLEWQRGGRFELRVFPIPKRGARRVVLAYTEVVKPNGGARRYTYPLAADPSGAARIGRFTLDLEVRGNDPEFGVRPAGYELERRASAADTTALHLAAQSFAPTGDLSVEYALPGRASELTAWTYLAAASGAPTSGSTGGAFDGSPYVAIALRPKLPRPERESGRAIALVVDASRSMLGSSYERATELATRLAGELDEADRVTVLACGVDCEVLGAGAGLAPGAYTAAKVRSFLKGITPEDASDVVGSVERALGELKSAASATRRVIVLGDGAPTVGQVRPGSIERAVGRAIARVPAAVVAVAVGSEADTATLDALARGGDGVMLPYAPSRSAAEMAYAVLGASYGNALANVSVTLPDGLHAIAPARLSSIPAGGEGFVLARMDNAETTGDVVLRGRVGGKPFEQRYPLTLKASSAAGNAFVPRLYAAARLADLEREGTDAAKTEAIALSTRFSVASRYTSLLVLESPAMFRAFGLEKASQAGAFTGDEAAESTSAEGAAEVAGDDLEQAENKAEEGSGLGGLGRTGRAAGAADGFASGAGTKTASPKKRALDMEMAPATPPMATAAPAPAAKPAESRPRPANEAEKADKRSSILAPEPQIPFEDPPRERTRRMIPMRRIWERAGEVFPANALPAASDAAARDTRDLLLAEMSFNDNPNRRDAVKKLFTLRLRAGEIERAAPLAETWAEKEPLDVEALTARADVLAARGERARAIRVLGSVLDAKPGDIASAKRLARLERWAGRSGLGCRFSIAIAEQKGSDAALLADAVRCARETLDGAVADELLTSAAPATRDAAERLLAGPRPDDQTLRGDIRLEARWQGGGDLDLALVDPDGHRVSWLGAPTRGIITARSAMSEGEESLGLGGTKAGDYAIEIVRSSGNLPSSGELTVTVAGTTRRLPFTLDGTRQRVGIARVSFRSKLVPL